MDNPPQPNKTNQTTSGRESWEHQQQFQQEWVNPNLNSSAGSPTRLSFGTQPNGPGQQPGFQGYSGQGSPTRLSFGTQPNGPAQQPGLQGYSRQGSPTRINYEIPPVGSGQQIYSSPGQSPGPGYQINQFQGSPIQPPASPRVSFAASPQQSNYLSDPDQGQGQWSSTGRRPTPDIRSTGQDESWQPPSVRPSTTGFLTRREQEHQDYGYRSLFRFSTKTEKLFLVLGLVSALLAGVCIPLMILQFGKLTDAMVLIDLIKKKGPETFSQIYGEKSPFCLEIPPDINGTIQNPDTRNNVIWNHINSFALWHAVLAIAMILFSAFYFLTWFICGERQLNRLSIAYFEAMLRKDMKWLDTRSSDSNYVNDIVEHTTRIRDGIGERVAITGFLFSVFGATMALALYDGWELTLVAFIALPLLGTATSFVTTAEANQIIEENKAYSKPGNLVEEILTNVRTVMVYGGQKKEFASFYSKLDTNGKKVYKRVIYTSLAMGLVWFLTYGIYGLSYWYGTSRVLADREHCQEGSSSYTPGDLVIIFIGVLFAAINIGLAFPIIQAIMIARRSSKEVFHIINTSSEVDNLSLEGYIPKRTAIGEVEFLDVFFTYPARKMEPVLRGVSFKIKSGMTVAVVGPTGGGKSTILKLITKEYLCDSGFVKLDGIDVRAYNTSWLRSQIAVVTQEPVLFNDTIEENVRMGNPGASFVEVQIACKQANVHDFITQLKQGYQTVVGFQGSKLSSGERQLIAIARALIRNPKILILDEPTSALDNQSEVAVQEAIRRASLNRTTFVVAHRLNTIVNSDLILVFNKGQIIEFGKHIDLLNLKERGFYYKLASGLFDVPSKSIPKDKAKEAAVMAASNQRRASFKILDNTMYKPFQTTLEYPVSEKVNRRLQEATKRSAAQEGQNDELVFTINPIDDPNPNPTEGGQGDSGMGWQGPRSSRNFSINPESFTIHREAELKMELHLWDKYTKHMNDYKTGPIQPKPLQSFTLYQGQYIPVPSKPKVEFFSVIKMVSFHRTLILLGVIGAIGMGLTLPLYGVLVGMIIKELSDSDIDTAKEMCLRWSLLFFLVGVFAGISVSTQSFTLGLAGLKAVNLLRKRLLFSILRQDAGWFEDPENGASTLSTRLDGDARSVQYVILTVFGVFVQCTATIVVSIVYSLLFASRLTLYCLFLVPIVTGASYLDGWLAKKQEDRTNKAMDDISKITLEVFLNRRVVLTSQLERYFIGKYERALIQSGKSDWTIGICRSLAYGFAQAITFLTYSACIFLAGYEMTGSNVEYNDVLIVGNELIFALIGVGTSLSIIPTFTKALAAGTRILKLLRKKPNIDFDVGGTEDFNTSGALDFRGVQFWYPHATDVHILKGISFSVQPGQMIALVGSSGSGKSTCVNLILRFYDATQGSITLDGTDVKFLNCASMRSHMALVEQEPRLFDRTVEENIAYGDNTRTIRVDEVIAAAKIVNIHTFITSLPEGYQTKAGASGPHLSRGQKQRIAIARALLRNPKILVLDEVTATLDRESEKVVQESIEIARKNRSCIAVSHRLSSVKHADLIIVMHKGNIVEFGQHESLLKKSGLYSVLWKAQNPLANENFIGGGLIGNAISGIFGKSKANLDGTMTGPRDVIGQLAEYANTAVGTIRKSIYQPMTEVAALPTMTNPTNSTEQPPSADGPCSMLCNIAGLK